MRLGLVDIGPLFVLVVTFLVWFQTIVPPRPGTDLAARPDSHGDAFATLATPAFCMGAVVLGHNLRKIHGDSHGFVCLVTPDVNETWVRILSQWWRVVQVPAYKPFGGFRRSWAKLFLFGLTDYRKLVYIDTDMLILGSLEELFDKPMLSCAPDAEIPQICNTGVLVIEPRDGLTNEMKKTAKEKQFLHGPGDQGFINGFFGGFTPISSKFNSPRMHGTGFGHMMKANVTRVVHFVCKKPWKCGRANVSTCGCGYPSMNVEWWRAWDEACAGRECMESWAE